MTTEARTSETPRGGADFSIVAIIPLYNGAPFIRQAVQSVLDQTVLPDEFFVIDDGSTDEGPAIVEAMARENPLITLLRKENGGQSSARNFGVRMSRSAYIALLDQDDGWYPDHLRRLLRPFQRSGRYKLGWVYSNLDEYDQGGQLRVRKMLGLIRAAHPKIYLDRCLSEDMFILPSASLISRTAFEDVGGFDERLSGYEDDDLFLRLFRNGYDNIYLDESLSFWRLYTASTSFSPRMAKSRMIYFDKLVETYPNEPTKGYFPTRWLIAPRFFRYLVAEVRRALRTDNSSLYYRMIADIKHVAPYLPVRWRLMAVTLSNLGASYELARMLWKMGLLDIAMRVAGKTIGR